VQNIPLAGWHDLLINKGKTKIMTKRSAKIDIKNTQVNFNASREVVYWAKKYNTSQQEIQQLFEQTGYSISKTLSLLQQRTQAA
jgi:hypothetical protein